MLAISNYAVLISAFFTALASTAVYVLSKAAERDKDRSFETYKLDATRNIAQAHEGAETARAEAATARADAERAKLETARISERLVETQRRLDEANEVTLFSEHQIDQIVQGMMSLKLGDAQPMAAAANDAQAQRRLTQLTTAFLRADRHLYTLTTGSLLAPAGEQGDVLIHYWSDDRRNAAEEITAVFRRAGLVANFYRLPPEAGEQERAATRNMVLIGIAARPQPVFHSSK